jgi:hypothetical protein
MQPAAYPPPPVISAEPLKPSGWWFGVAAGVAVAGIVIAIIVFVAAINGLVDQVNDFQRVTLPGSDTVTLESAGGYTIYHEFDGASSDSGFAPGVSVTIAGPDGEPVEVKTYDATVTYSWGGHEGIAVYSFTVDQPGDYTVSAEGETGQVAIGRGIGSSLVGGIVGSLALGIGASLAGGIIAIVVGIKRGRNRRGRQLYGPQFGPGPPGGWGGGPGWPQATQPGWPQSQPGAPGPYPPQQPVPGPYSPPQPPPGQYPPGPMQPPPGLPPT